MRDVSRTHRPSVYTSIASSKLFELLYNVKQCLNPYSKQVLNFSELTDWLDRTIKAAKSEVDDAKDAIFTVFVFDLIFFFGKFRLGRDYIPMMSVKLSLVL